jgi:exopolysaccharide biosynthesis polyprenyl glycosylphosphotransferase
MALRAGDLQTDERPIAVPATACALEPFAPALYPPVLSAAWSGWQRPVKRLIDILAAALLLLLLAPVFALIAIAIKLDSRGPVLFRQTRSGKDGVPFAFLKFRGMVADAEARRAALEALNEAQGPIFKMKRDPRVTRVGRVLRRTSLDELPQLWNVLRGEMSLVGPRPPLPSEVAKYEPWHRGRLAVKPGLTGLWQVSGRNLLSFDAMVRLDCAYIARWSLWLDLRILLQTVLAVSFMRGAY